MISCNQETKWTAKVDEIIKDLILVATVGWLGVCTVFPFTLWWYFRRSRAEIGRSVGWMAFGEGCGMAGTLLFACCEYARLFDIVDWRISTALRVAMGSVAFFTSVHLMRTTINVIFDYENKRKG